MVKSILKVAGVGIIVVVGMMVWYVAYFMIGFNFRLTKTAELKAMEKVSRTIKLVTAVEKSRYENDFSHVLGKPNYAKLRVNIEPTTGHTLDDVLNEIEQWEIKNNWVDMRTNEIGGNKYVVASFPLEKFVVEATAVSLPDEGIVRIYYSTHLYNSNSTTPKPKLQIVR